MGVPRDQVRMFADGLEFQHRRAGDTRGIHPGQPVRRGVGFEDRNEFGFQRVQIMDFGPAAGKARVIVQILASDDATQRFPQRLRAGATTVT